MNEIDESALTVHDPTAADESADEYLLNDIGLALRLHTLGSAVLRLRAGGPSAA